MTEPRTANFFDATKSAKEAAKKSEPEDWWTDDFGVREWMTIRILDNQITICTTVESLKVANTAIWTCDGNEP